MQYVQQFHAQQVQNFEEENIQVTLHNQDLWDQFHSITNEMILTKVGRRMFPIIAVNVTGLDPDKMYTIELSFQQIDNHRWRYVNAQWQAGLKPDPAINRQPYQHPDSPNYGRKWMKDPILFSKVKLTNKADRSSASNVLLNSLHKYRPRIAIIDIMAKKMIFEAEFIQTEFIAVTAYQNEEVKALKIRYNPFAKAFLDGGNVKEETQEESMQYPVFYNQPSSSSGPDRLKRQSCRSSPYNFSPKRLKTSPTATTFGQDVANLKNDTWVSPVSTTPYSMPLQSSTDMSPSYYNVVHAPSAPGSVPDPNNYYANYYYSATDPYYYPYSSTPGTSQHPFMAQFGYPMNESSTYLPAAGLLPFQQSIFSSSSNSDFLNTCTSLKSEFEQP